MSMVAATHSRGSHPSLRSCIKATGFFLLREEVLHLASMIAHLIPVRRFPLTNIRFHVLQSLVVSHSFVDKSVQSRIHRNTRQ
jgi:hypothetical protein